MRLSHLLIILLTLGLFACKSSQVAITEPIPDGIQFESGKEFELVLGNAKSADKLVFVEFYADWCVPCKMMDKEVFSDKGIGDFFNKKFINVKVDGEKDNGPDLAAIFEVRAYPTLLFLDEIGRVVERREGAAYHTDLMLMAENALSNKEAMTYTENGTLKSE